MPMLPRSPHEPHRTATPLELFFDLVFVVAVARAAAELHHAIAADHVAHGLVGFAFVFFAIWWAWMNFTWFASAYDCDDLSYRVAAFVQITGALVLAAGVPQMFETTQPNAAVVGGYVIMRLGMVAQWLRAAAGDPPRRTTALRNATGIVFLQMGWVAVLWAPTAAILPICGVLIALELTLPIWASRAARTPWHPHHIAERYGLFTIIVLGESVLAGTIAVDAALESGLAFASLLPVIAGGLLTVYAMWWIYFDRPVHHLLASARHAFTWGYGHYVIFASAAGVGAGLAVNADVAIGHAVISPTLAGLAVTLPISAYLAALWVLHNQPGFRRGGWVIPAAIPLLMISALSEHAVLWAGLILTSVVAMKVRIGGEPATA